MRPGRDWADDVRCCPWIRSVALLFAVAPGAAALGQPVNEIFTFRLGGPCGQTIRGEPGSEYDDGTGGAGVFEVARPGHTWDVTLTRETGPEVDHPILPVLWTWSVGVEGPGWVTGIADAEAFPLEVRGGSDTRIVLAELTGAPFGAGPRTEENHGAQFAEFLGLQAREVDRDGTYVLARLRVHARFPAVVGEMERVRVHFAPREGTFVGFFNSSLEGSAYLAGIWGTVTPTDGNPPLLAEDCEITLVAEERARLIRCDANADGRLQISDAIWMLHELFVIGTATECPEAADCDGDGERNITDAVFALEFLFGGGGAPPPPYPECGPGAAFVSECAAGSAACA